MCWKGKCQHRPNKYRLSGVGGGGQVTNEDFLSPSSEIVNDEEHIDEVSINGREFYHDRRYDLEVKDDYPLELHVQHNWKVRRGVPSLPNTRTDSTRDADSVVGWHERQTAP
ncbi:unnamed protein product [Dicrocoelium dendriticum]|nr:unnamed protein product [Dicrocoelium dendriticum]